MQQPDLVNGPATVLIIDDNREHLRVLRDILKSEGYIVRVAPNGHLGLTSARTEPPDIILLDIAMPGLNGYDVCRQLQHDDQTRTIPIIFISAMDDMADKVHAFAAGGVDYMTKPFQSEEVLARVATHLALQGVQRQLRQQNAQLQQEIDERQRAEQMLRRLERGLRALSQSNEQMLRATSEQELLQAICQHIVEQGGYRLAWVGCAEHDGGVRWVRPVAQAGYEEGYLQTLDIRWDDTERGRGPTGTAIRTGTTSIITHILTDPVFEPWRSEAIRRGYASSISLPLICDHTTLGALSVYASEPDAFDVEEVHLLTQLANNLAYGISALRSRAAREQAETALREHHERLQTLSKRLVEVQEMERRAIARALHDEVGQILTGLNLSLEMMARLPPHEMGERMEQVQALVNELIASIRDMSMQLRPPMLDDMGLLSALIWYFDRYTDQTNIRVVFKHNGIEQRFPTEIETTAYRVIQEALTNVACHARAETVEVRVWARNGLLGLQVIDQGRGFDPDAVLNAPLSGGLSAIRERVRLLNGDMYIDAAPGNGCRLTIELALDTSDSLPEQET
jgi:signal transduction histidine kinase/DNA-binding response OmpR family regulator